MVEQGINMENNMDTIFKELRFMGNEDLMFNILDMQKNIFKICPMAIKEMCCGVNFYLT